MKIVSLLPSATEIVCSLGLADSIVAVTHECDFPASIAGRPAITASRISHETMTSLEIDHAVRSQLDGHGSIYDLDNELLQSLDPDLIITQELCDVCAVSYKTVSKAARVYAAGASVVSLEPNTIGDIFDNINTVGELAGVPGHASEVVADLESRLDVIRKKTAGIERRPTVFMLEWLEPPFAPGHWVPEQVEIAGGKCLLGEAGRPSVATTYDAIRDAAPDIIVLIPCGYYTDDIVRQLKFTVLPSNWSDIPAVGDGNIWAMDATSYFSRPGPRIVDGVEKLARVLHPEIFGPPGDTDV